VSATVGRQIGVRTTGVAGLLSDITLTCTISPDILEPLSVDKGFHVLSWRWVEERAFAWQSHQRRHSKVYEWLCAENGI
jgi:hypothetical protein